MSSRIGSFAPYLDALNSSQTPPVSPHSQALALLIELAKTDEQPLNVLQAASGLTFSEFADAVKWLQEAEFISVSGAPGQEVVSLTASGRTLGALGQNPPAKP
jgi:hypothetical protein